ncbi:hypothetical protein [Synoicihabitans lomoniglobus]|uniref:Nitrate reductase n=1 Tax=Synoicihabitans lomoniglobus TaxID=2909285 RepID=A0AAE9ZYP8_9BACT|nr:hypothetical protein [Opitutaceae bacterium LMO-M01]WED65515.1 hypothetical protein PXH66_01460 [Opitutaceae bacterium LMO-M01]
MHTLIPADDARSGIDVSHTQAIKRWTAEILDLGDDDVVTVMESACVDPGCPLVESTIAVFGADGSTRRWKLTRQRYAIVRFIVEQALAQSPT